MNKHQSFDPLTKTEYRALTADIRARGAQAPVEKDEDGNILDGHHRVEFWEELHAEGVELPPYPALIRIGLSETKKLSFVRALTKDGA